MKNDKKFEGCSEAEKQILCSAIDYENKNEISKAERVYKSLISKNKKIPYAYTSLGCINYDRKEFKRAAFYFRKALKINEDKKNTWLLLIESEENYGQLKQAIADYKYCIKKFPREIEFYSGLRLIYEYKKQYKKAKNLYEIAIKIQDFKNAK